MLTTLVRGALAGFLLLAGLLVVAAPASAFACTCVVADADRQTRRADVVFVGTVDMVSRAGQQFEYDVTATHAYKGTVDREIAVTSAVQATACGLGELTVGKDYLFVAHGDAAPYTSSSCDGSGPVSARKISQIEGALGAGSAIEPPAPPTATRTLVEESPPGAFARLAAPGGALLLIGLLGLLVVGRLGRR